MRGMKERKREGWRETKWENPLKKENSKCVDEGGGARDRR